MKQINIQLSEEKIDQINKIIIHQQKQTGNKITLSAYIRDLIEKDIKNNIISKGKTFKLSDINDYFGKLNRNGKTLSDSYIICQDVNYNMNSDYEELVISGPLLFGDLEESIDVFDIAYMLFEDIYNNKTDINFKFDISVDNNTINGTLKVRNNQEYGFNPVFSTLYHVNHHWVRVAHWYDVCISGLRACGPLAGYELDSSIVKFDITYEYNNNKIMCSQKSQYISYEMDIDFLNLMITNFPICINWKESDKYIFDFLNLAKVQYIDSSISEEKDLIMNIKMRDIKRVDISINSIIEKEDDKNE